MELFNLEKKLDFFFTLIPYPDGYNLLSETGSLPTISFLPKKLLLEFLHD